jgi:hypothetical protein
MSQNWSLAKLADMALQATLWRSNEKIMSRESEDLFFDQQWSAKVSKKKPGDLKMIKNLGTIDASRSFIMLGDTMPKRKRGKPNGNFELVLVKSDSAAGQRSCCLWKEGRFLGLSGTARSIRTRQKESIPTSTMVQISPADSQRSHPSQPHHLA